MKLCQTIQSAFDDGRITDFKGPCLMALRGQEASAADRYLWMRLNHELDLREARPLLAASLQLFLGTAASCEKCSAKNGVIVSINTPFEEIVPPDCVKLEKGLCSIMTTAWIKWPDGRRGVDRRQD